MEKVLLVALKGGEGKLEITRGGQVLGRNNLRILLGEP